MNIAKKQIIVGGIGVLTLLVIALLSQAAVFATAKESTQSGSKIVLTDPSVSVHKIILTPNGFEPENLTIRQNDTVVFSNTTMKDFWPASNLHPEHSIYKEFDPKKKLSPDETWEFKFEKAGRYKFHDHLFANYTGLIVALSPDDEKNGVSQTPSADINACAKLQTVEEKQQCWDEQLEAVLETDGIDTAFDYFIKLYNTEPDIPKECHGWGHTLGEAAYELYKDGQELNMRPESAYCGYGYFHGFIGALIKDTGQVQQTKEFCEYVAKELDGKVQDVYQNCTHGVGHGTTAMLLEEGGEHVGDFIKTATKGLDICELIYTTLEDLENCYDGVFNELHLELFNSRYGMNFDDYMAKSNNDPFLYCKMQEERHKLACFYELSGMFWKIFDHDVVKATEYALLNTENLQVRGEKVIAKIAADQIQFDIVKESHEKSTDACRIVPEFLFRACFEGIVNGFIQHGEPGNVHEKAYAFCEEDQLTKEEADMCYTTVTRMIKWLYTPERFKESCESIQYSDKVPECAAFKPV